MKQPSLVRDGRILVVDDEPANLKLLDKMLAGQGYSERVLIQDSRQVLAAYKDARPDLILLDINMPYLDGYQVLEQLNGLRDPLLPPIVVLTAQYGRDTLIKALAAGARDFIGKPFDRAELLMRVRNLLEAHLGHRLLYEQKDVLEELVRRRTEDLQRTQLEVVQRLGKAAEYRDEETGNHILRMSYSSEIIARSLGWGQDQCDLILNASPMHDIGKIGIPDAILLKPGKFEPDEWEVMKTHTTIGGRLLEGESSALMRLAREIALSHHERWDGSGYPRGIQADAIPMSGRIVAIADVFDALTSSRPYKKAWPIDAAIDYIRENSGKHFDPLVVEAFMDNATAIVALRDRFCDS